MFPEIISVIKPGQFSMTSTETYLGNYNLRISNLINQLLAQKNSRLEKLVQCLFNLTIFVFF